MRRPALNNFKRVVTGHDSIVLVVNEISNTSSFKRYFMNHPIMHGKFFIYDTPH